MSQVGPIGMPWRLSDVLELAPDPDLAGEVAGVRPDVRDVLRVDRRQQAQDHDQEEDAAEEQRDLVAPQPPPGEAVRADAGRQVAAELRRLRWRRR